MTDGQAIGGDADPPRDRPTGAPTSAVDPDGAAERWLAGLRAEAGADRRRRTAWLVRQAEEEASLLGILADLAEQERPVVLEVTGGRRHRGRVRVVGEDFVGLRTGTGAEVLVARAAITGVRPTPGDAGPTGDRRLAPRLSLAGVLGALAGSGVRMTVVPFGGGEPVVGELRSVGLDVLAVRLDGEGGLAHLPLAAIAEVQLLVSG